MAQWVGRTLSKVKIERLLGRGGMAEVYLGLHTTLNRHVAVKILHGHLSGDTNVLQRFRAEAQAVAGFRHPNIVHILDFDVADGSPYIVMELLEGMSLAEYLQGLHGLGTSLPLETVARLTLGLASALDYAHAQGIIHRDVKPANVMLRAGASPIRSGLPLQADVEPILTDFGVARIAGGITQTVSGTILGTPAYMSPEQVRGEQADARSDVYSLGIIVYELLAGRLPFTGETETPASVLYKHLNEPPPPLANTQAPIREVVERALAKDREARYQRAGDFARDLARAVGLSVPAEAMPTSVPRPARRAPLRIDWRVGVGAGAGAVLLVGLAILGWPLLRGQAPPTPAETPSTTVTATLAVAANPSPTPNASFGIAGFEDDRLNVELSSLSAPEAGENLQAWLEAAEGAPFLIGTLQAPAGGASLDFADPAGENLLIRYDGIAISREPEAEPDAARQGPVVYTAMVEPETLALIRLLEDVAPDVPTSTAVLQGLDSQLHHFTSHLNLTLEAIANGDLNGARAHSEHVINITEGRDGAMFGDWNGDGLVQNPGDAFGLLPYLRLLEVLSQPAPGEPESTPDPQRPEAVLATRLEHLIAITEEARDLASRIATADLISEVQPLTGQFTELPVEAETLAVLESARTLDLAVRVSLVAAGP